MSKKKVTSSSKKKPTKKATSTRSSKVVVTGPKSTKNKSQNPMGSKKKTTAKKKSTIIKKTGKSKPNSFPKSINSIIDANYKPSDNEEYMNENSLPTLKATMDWKNELISQSQETLYNLKTESRDVSDEAERASRKVTIFSN